MMPCLSLLCFMVFGPPGVALDGLSKPVQRLPATSVQAFGAQNKCLAWSDGCVLCSASDGGKASCSTPGIACTPGPIACQRPASP